MCTVKPTYEELEHHLVEAQAALEALQNTGTDTMVGDEATLVAHLVEAGTALQAARLELEDRVRKHAAELAEANEQLRREMEDRSRSQASLHEGEQRYRELFDRMSNGVAVYQAVDDGADFTLADFNRAAERIEQVTKDAVIGRRVTDAFPGIEEFGLLDVFRRVWRTGCPEHYPAALYRDRRIVGWRENFVYRLPSGEIVAVYDDITERKQMEEQLRTAEQEWQHIFQAIGHPAVILDPEHRIIAANRAVVKAAGQPEEALLGRKCYEVFHGPGTACPPEQCPLEKLQHSGRFESVAMSIEVLNGVYLVSCTPVFDDAGQLRKIIHIATDITERTRAEEAVRRESEFNKTLINASPAFFVAIDGRGQTLMMNPSMLTALGYAENEVVGRDYLSTFVPPKDHEQLQKVFETLIRSGKPTINENRVITRDGRELLVEWHGRPVFNASGQFDFFFGVGLDITERKRAEAMIRAGEAILNETGSIARIGGWEHDLVAGRAVWTKALYDIIEVDSGPPPGPGEHLAYYPPQDRAVLAQVYQRAIDTGEPFDVELQCRTAKGRPIWARIIGRPVFEEGRCVKMLGTFQDISDRKEAERERSKLEAQLRQAHKMEAIGQLAGGVAHDFNNILTAILGNVELAMAELETGRGDNAGVMEAMQQVQQSTERAATLTRQLLAFSRRQASQPRLLDLNQSVSGMERMLRRLLTENIVLDIIPDPSLRLVKVDPGQMEQVIMNLVVNARDAMPDGGRLIVQTQNTTLDERYAASHPGVRPGSHVMLSVSDTGCGMDADTLEHIFEPFFTTKAQGRGTGLGLATVYGVVRQCDGHIAVYSEPGHGTTFRIFFPPAPDGPSESPAACDEPVKTGSETVMICEDDQAVRTLTVNMLKSAGYTVLSASGGAQALEIASRHNGPLHLLITDVVMPGINGRKLADLLTAARPDIRVLFISGYTADIIAHHGVLEPHVQFLEKPFARPALLHRVRDILDCSDRRI